MELFNPTRLWVCIKIFVSLPMANVQKIRIGITTCMKTAEITRSKTAATGVKPPSTWAVFADIYRREGIAGVNKGVNAVALRQCTNWGSRLGLL